MKTLFKKAGNSSKTSSALSSSSEQTPCMKSDNHEKNKMKEVDEASEPRCSESSSSLSLDLKLSNDVGGSNIEFNLLNQSNVMNDTQENDSSSNEKVKVFSCIYCKREFSTSQALGGHQNAHKQERALTKRRQVSMDQAVAFGNNHPFSFYSPCNNGSFNHSLGAQMNHLVHKPAYNSFPLQSSGNYSFSWLARQGMNMNTISPHQLSRGRMRMNDFRTSKPRFEESDVLATTSITIHKNSSCSSGDCLQGGDPSKSDQQDAKELDLSLKL